MDGDQMVDQQGGACEEDLDDAVAGGRPVTPC